MRLPTKHPAEPALCWEIDIFTGGYTVSIFFIDDIDLLQLQNQWFFKKFSSKSARAGATGG